MSVNDDGFEIMVTHITIDRNSNSGIYIHISPIIVIAAPA